MTTITIDRAVLLRALEALRPATAPNGAKRDAAFEELRTALAAPAQPTWHDAPTVPGLWLRVGKTSGDASLLWYQETSDIWYEGYRWCGPLPEDTK